MSPARNPSTSGFFAHPAPDNREHDDKKMSNAPPEDSATQSTTGPVYCYSVPHDGMNILPSGADSPRTAKSRFSSLSKLHSWMWVTLVSIALIWGTITGAAIFGGIGVGLVTAFFGLFATFALALTLFLLGTRSESDERDV